jgi:hypothetical protein
MITGRLLLLLAALPPAAGACSSGGQPASDESAGGAAQTALSQDPCGLLTRAEAEAVLGSLVAQPYRTKADTAVADSAGPGCAYETAGGRVLLLTPEWTYGKMTLDVERLVGGLVRQVADLPGVEADTLEGLWDDAVVGLSGDLVLRKGARSLTIRYLSSSTDAAGSIRLSGPALARLAAVPEPPRPEVSSDGCPLPPDLVSRLIGIPVRLAPRPVQLMDACSYQLEEDPTVEVELAIKPAELADMLFQGLHSRAGGMAGAGADSLAIGAEGWAYGSSSGSEAAVRAGEKVYHARMAHPLSTTTPSQKEAMVRLVAAMMEWSD